MLPDFPKFRKIDISDKELVNSVARNLPPYSDFNFTSLWSWDTDAVLEVSLLNTSLVVKFSDYITHDHFFSFIGIKNVDNTIDSLLSYSSKHGFAPVLKLIPSSVIKRIENPSKYDISEDRDNFDYVINLADFTNLKGTKQRTARHEINNFSSAYGANAQIKTLELKNKQNYTDIIDVFYSWEKSRKKNRQETQNELDALIKLLESADHFDLHVMGCYINSKLVGFSIYEILHNKYSIGHFEKADTNYKGIFRYMKHHAALSLMKHDVLYFNEEQDLGLENLRKSKLSHRPEHFLKKYTISLKK